LREGGPDEPPVCDLSRDGCRWCASRMPTPTSAPSPHTCHRATSTCDTVNAAQCEDVGCQGGKGPRARRGGASARGQSCRGEGSAPLKRASLRPCLTRTSGDKRRPGPPAREPLVEAPGGKLFTLVLKHRGGPPGHHACGDPAKLEMYERTVHGLAFFSRYNLVCPRVLGRVQT